MNAADYKAAALRTDLPDYAAVRLRTMDDKFARLMHAAMGMTTEAGEFVDALKKHAIYGKAIDEVNLKEELGDQLWYIALACEVLGTSFEEVMDVNIAKLRARFPDKFTEQAALVRDLDAERKVLEGAEQRDE